MKNLKKRILTSIILISLLCTVIMFKEDLMLYLLIVSSIIIFIEFDRIIKNIWKYNKNIIITSNLLTIFYLLFFIYSAYDVAISQNAIIFVLMISVLSDIGGFAVGKIIGGKKLTRISPNKTISGCIGSFAFAFVALLFFSISDIVKFDITFYEAVFLTVFLSLISQLGDLFISFFKRKANIKDTGSILPGHGGLLDRVDGILFSVPVAFVILKIF